MIVARKEPPLTRSVSVASTVSAGLVARKEDQIARLPAAAPSYMSRRAKLWTLALLATLPITGPGAFILALFPLVCTFAAKNPVPDDEEGKSLFNDDDRVQMHGRVAEMHGNYTYGSYQSAGGYIFYH